MLRLYAVSTRLVPTWRQESGMTSFTKKTRPQKLSKRAKTTGTPRRQMLVRREIKR